MHFELQSNLTKSLNRTLANFTLQQLKIIPSRLILHVSKFQSISWISSRHLPNSTHSTAPWYKTRHLEILDFIKLNVFFHRYNIFTQLEDSVSHVCIMKYHLHFCSSRETVSLARLEKDSALSNFNDIVCAIERHNR